MNNLYQQSTNSQGKNRLYDSGIDAHNRSQDYMMQNQSPQKNYNMENRSVFESELTDRLREMKNLYEMRHQSLEQNIQEAYERIMGDELLNTMKKDPISQEYVQQRIKELFEEIIFGEREVVIEKLSSQYSYLKVEYQKVESEKRKLGIQYEDQLEESARIMQLLKDELSKETHKRQFYESEYNNLQQKVNDLSQQFDHAMITKDRDVNEQQGKDREIIQILEIKMQDM